MKMLKTLTVTLAAAGLVGLAVPASAAPAASGATKTGKPAKHNVKVRHTVSKTSTTTTKK